MSYREMLHHKTQGKRIFELPDDAEAREKARKELAADGWKGREAIRAEMAAGETSQGGSGPDPEPEPGSVADVAEGGYGGQVERVPAALAGLDDMDKNELESYAKEVHGIDLDKRKSLANLIAQVKQLEAGE